MASYIFAEPKKGQEILGHNYLWPLFKFYELTECMRQRDDKAFAEALNRLALGKCTEKDIQMFKSREIAANHLSPPESAIRLNYTNDDVQLYNAKKLATLNEEGCFSYANDRVQGTGKKEHHDAIRKRAKELPIQKTQGLPLEIQFKLTMRYMMTVNSDTSDGLVNGAIGILRQISYGTTTEGQRIPLKIWMEYLNDTGKKRRETCRQKVDQLVPIIPEIRSIHSWPGKNLEVVRTQFNVVPAEAISIHKSQGSTFTAVVLSTQYCTKTGQKRNIPRRGLYVGLSRCTSLKGLFIDGEFIPPSPPLPNDPVVLAMQQLTTRPVFEEHVIAFPDGDCTNQYREADTNVPTDKIVDFSETANVSKVIIVDTLDLPSNTTNTFFKIGHFGGSLTSFGSFAPGCQADDACKPSWIDTLFMSSSTLINDKNPNSDVCYTALNPAKTLT